MHQEQGGKQETENTEQQMEEDGGEDGQKLLWKSTSSRKWIV